MVSFVLYDFKVLRVLKASKGISGLVILSVYSTLLSWASFLRRSGPSWSRKLAS